MTKQLYFTNTDNPRQKTFQTPLQAPLQELQHIWHSYKGPHKIDWWNLHKYFLYQHAQAICTSINSSQFLRTKHDKTIQIKNMLLFNNLMKGTYLFEEMEPHAKHLINLEGQNIIFHHDAEEGSNKLQGRTMSRKHPKFIHPNK